MTQRRTISAEENKHPWQELEPRFETILRWYGTGEGADSQALNDALTAVVISANQTAKKMLASHALACGQCDYVDATQEWNFQMLRRGYSGFRPARAFHPFGYRALKNICYSAKRRDRRQFSQPDSKHNRSHEDHGGHAMTRNDSWPVDRENKAQRRNTVRLEFDPTDMRGDAATIAERDDLRRRIVREVQALPPNFRKAVTLKYFHGKSLAEGAVICNITSNAFNNWLHRGRALLRVTLADMQCFTDSAREATGSANERFFNVLRIVE